MNLRSHPDSRQRPVESTPTTSEIPGNTLCFSLDEFPELSWIAHYISAQTHLRQSIAALNAEIRALDRQQPLDGGHIEQYQSIKKGKVYTYHRYRWYVGRTKAGNPKLKQKHLNNHMKGEYEYRMAIGAQKRLLEQERSELQARSDALAEKIRETHYSLDLSSFPEFSATAHGEEVRP